MFIGVESYPLLWLLTRVFDRCIMEVVNGVTERYDGGLRSPLVKSSEKVTNIYKRLHIYKKIHTYKNL